MSAAQGLVLELLAGGLSRRAIGQAIGRNDRLIGYVEKGQKPGENLAGALAELRDRLAGGASRDELRAPVTAAPARRQRVDRATGELTPARVRHRGTIDTGRSMTATSKLQATRNGARSLASVIAEADARGQRLAATLTLAKRAKSKPEGSSGAKRRRGVPQGPTPAVRRRKRSHGDTIELGDIEPADLLGMVDDYGGDVTTALVAYAYESGAISGDGPEASAAEVVSVELRAY